MKYLVGIDIGGTYTKIVLVNLSGKIIENFSIFTDQKNAKKNIKNIINSLHNFSHHIGQGQLLGIGIGVPGHLDVKREKILRLPNLKILEKEDFKKILSQEFKVPVRIENDTNCLAWGEWYLSYRKAKSLVAISLGTGIGGGIVLNGRLYHGQKNAGEIGHMTIENKGIKCNCGNYDCLEEYLAIRGINRLAKEMDLTDTRPKKIFLRAKEGDKKSTQVYQKAGQYLGIALSNLSYILHPEVIVVGGGIANSGSLLMSPAKTEFKKRLIIEPPKVVLSKLGADAGAVGAALLHYHPPID